jgi:hypothetical protein
MDRKKFLNDLREGLQREFGCEVHVGDRKQIWELAEAKPGVLTGIPVAMKEYKPPTSDYQVTKCEGCGCETWIGPRQIEKRKADKWPFLCVVCIRLSGIHDQAVIKNLGGP